MLIEKEASMSDQPKPVDINAASLDELARIPGIGPTIAARILSRRPYQTVDELTSVPGIGVIALEKIRQYFIPLSNENGQSASNELLTDETHDDEPPLESQFYESEVIALPAPGQVELLDANISTDKDQEQRIPEAVEQASEIDDEPQILLAEEEPAMELEPTQSSQPEQDTGPTVVIPKSEPVRKDQPRYASRADAFWISFGSSFLAFLLAIGLTLGVLALINNGLRYVSPAQLGSVNRQVDGLSTQASILQQDLDGMRTRVDNLEGLSGRVSTIEQTAEQLRSDLNTAAGQVEQLNQNISGLQTEVTELRNVSDRFQNFLDGLRELLNNEQQ
jgi:competence ComEA-like helix-hairpin-helix protein